MTRLPRPCVGRLPDGTTCGRPWVGGRCPDHPRRRASPSERGYDARYREDRARILTSEDGTPVRCQLRLEGCTIFATTADHPVALARGGHRRQRLVPACSHCNSSKGARDLGDDPASSRGLDPP